MRLRGGRFNGSDSMLKTQKDLETVVGSAVWFTEFTPVRTDHLGFVRRLLLTFCELDICCSIVNSYPAYIAGAVGVCSVGELALGVFYFAKVDSPFLDHVFLNDPYFEVGPFSFALRESMEHDDDPDYFVYQVTLGEETYTCLLGFFDTVTVPCGSTSNINFTEFLWDNTVVFSFQKYGIVGVPLDSPKILYLRHHGAESSGWTQSSLCQRCARYYQPRTYPFLPQCTASSSCKCNVCVSGNPLPSGV